MKEEQNRTVVVAKTAFKIAQIAIAALIILSAIFLIVSTGRPRVARGLWLKAPRALTATPTPPAAIETAESLEALRRLHGVRALQPMEQDKLLAVFPNGVYGYTVPWLLNTDPTGVIGGTGVGPITLFRQSGGTLVMEIHKANLGLRSSTVRDEAMLHPHPIVLPVKQAAQ